MPAKSLLGEERYWIVMKYNAYGWSSDLATPVFLSESDESIANCKKPYEFWCSKTCLEQLSLHNLDMVERSYNERITNMDSNNITLLVKNSWFFVRVHIPRIFLERFNHLYKESAVKSNAMALADTLAIDYFTENLRICIKNHPNAAVIENQIPELYGQTLVLLVECQWKNFQKFLRIRIHF